MSNDKDYYGILGVSPDADPETIEEAYERLAKELQPDVNAEPSDPDRMREIDEAFDVLDDPERRAEYDRALDSSWRRSAPPVWAGGAAHSGSSGGRRRSLGVAPTTRRVSLRPTARMHRRAAKGGTGILIAAACLLGAGLIAAGRECSCRW